MRPNMGSLDRTIRFVLGLGIIILGFVFHTWWGVVGLIPLGTAFIRWCPLYAPFKISTIRKKESDLTA